MLRRILISIINRIIGRLSVNDLINRGLVVGKNCSFQEGVKIDASHCWLIEIGNNVTFAPNVQIIAHDASTKRHLNLTRIGKVKIGDNVFVGAGSIVLPDVSIGDNSVIGAGSIVTKNIPSEVVAGGNPARVITSLGRFIDKHESQINESPCFSAEYKYGNGLSYRMKLEMISKLGKGPGYIV